MYCKKCNSLLNQDGICPVCDSDTAPKESNELSQAIDALKGGNQEAFNIFYNYTNKYVYSRAKMLLSDEQAANDIMQEVYISAYKNINSLKSNDSVFAWLRTITFNASNRMMKKAKSETVLSEENEDMLEALPDENEQIEEDYMNKQDIEIIHACINRLSNEHRTVLLAYYYDNLKVEEIAELLQISSGTVKSRLYTARKKLKEYIEEEEKKNGYKLHSFGTLSLAFALRSLLQQNIDSAAYNNETLYNSICKQINLSANSGITTNSAKPKSKILNAVGSNSKSKIIQRIAEIGVKKVVLSTVAAITAAGVVSGAVAVVVTSNLKNNLTENYSSSESTIQENISSEEVSSVEETISDEVQSTEASQNSSNIETNDTPFDINAVYNTYVDTIVINQKTRYYGYIGYFALDSSSSNDVLERFDRYGIPYKEDFPFWSSSPTEYRAEDGTPIVFYGPDTDRLVIRDETDLYMGKETGGVYKRVVKIIDGEGITPENNISPESCDTLYTKKLVNYLGYDGYFVDEHTQEALKKGYGTYPTEYYDVKTGSNIKFVFAAEDVTYDNMDLKLRRKAFEKGIGSIPVNVVQYADTIPMEHYDIFKYDIGVYYFKEKDFDMKPGGFLIDTWSGDIEIHTVGKDSAIEEEIKTIYEDTYGEEFYGEVHCFLLGYYYVDGYDGVCNVYTYYVYAP